ncbi:tetratricopeptide repeat protein [Fulvivirga sp. 29W222]|uniref:Tetratricopeptide repeat protein n=1 Tax=Fulvivirga marina TaxID=2494733 RepID=A0A937FW41_9BACT|nr:tetratricopeptide repeat protein [Fulvivirga marina]MBL6445401.1 tetratricopeptide repeat protein [Fulvivirga marina]
MKIVRVALMAIVFFTACNTETAEPSATQLPDDPEQLKALLEGAQSAQVKLEAYSALHNIHRKTDPELAFFYLEKQWLLAKDVSNYLEAGKACYNMGLIKKNEGDFVKAVEFYLEAINNFEEVGDLTKMGSALNNLGVIFMETGNFEYAIKFYNNTKNIYEANQDVRRQILANYNLGICYFSQKEADYATAEKYLKDAERLAEGLAERKAYYLNKIYNYLGALYYKKGDYTKAKEAYLESVNFTEPAEESDQFQYIAYANVSEAEMGAGNYEAAHQWMEKALNIAQGANLKAELMISGYNIQGQLYQHQGKYKESIEALEAAIALADDNIINEPLQETLRIIRLSYKGLNKLGKAVSADRYDHILELDGKQDRLEKDLVENTNFQALQAALGLSIELDNQRKENRAEVEEKAVFIIITILLALIVGIIAYRLRTKAMALTHAGNKLSLVQEILKD